MSDIQSVFRQAVDAAQRQDRPTARSLLKQVVREDPRHRDAWVLAAHVVETRREAIGCLRHALQIDPAHEYSRKMLERLEAEEKQDRPAAGNPRPAPAPTFSGAARTPPPAPASSTPAALPPPGRAKNSGLMTGALIGITLLCIGALAVALLAGNSARSLFGGGPTPSPEILLAVVHENIRATNAEDISDYMATIHPRSAGYAVTERTLPEVWSSYDLSVRVSDLRVLENSGREARVEFTLTTRRIRGPAFRDNIVRGVFILRRDGDEWKIYDQEVKDVQYLN